MIFTSSHSSCGYASMPTGTIAALLRVDTHRDHNSSYFLSGLFFFQGPALSVTSLLTPQSYAGIKRQRKTITDPLTPISQTLGVWEKSTYKAGTDLLIGPQ